MFSEPLLAHPAEIGGVDATWHRHPRDDADRDQHDADADDEEHMVVAAISRIAMLTRRQMTVCPLVHKASWPVHSGTAPFEAGAYTGNMQLVSIKPIAAMLWVSAAFVMGIAANVASLSSWAVLTGVAVVPPLVMMWRWNDPRETMSESLQEALR